MNDISSYKKSSASLDFLKKWTQEFTQRTSKKPECYVRSLGCQQNVSDGEKLKGALMIAGFEPTDVLENASVIIFNTCAVRENAEDHLYGLIGDLKSFKAKHPDVILGVCGCMAQEKASADRIMKVYRQVDLVFGTFAYGDLYEMLQKVITERSRVVNIAEKYTDIDEEFYQHRDDPFVAFVPIMYGCNNFCTYCIVPYVRGRERSRNPEAVIKEVEGLVKDGYKEIMLLGQNVNSYSYGFPELLRRINEIDGDFRIRFMSSHPKDASHELINAIAECDKVCKQLHLALQSGCDRVLHEMNRRYTKADYMAIVDYARSKIPGFSFSTDVLVGFPGETYEEFLETKDFVKQVKFDNIYSFVYSKRNGTKAASMKDDISDKQKGLWLRELLLEQRDTAQEWLSRFVGKECRVLCDGKGKAQGTLTGKNDEGIIVNFSGGEELIGQFVTVKITKAMNWALNGSVIQ